MIFSCRLWRGFGSLHNQALGRRRAALFGLESSFGRFLFLGLFHGYSVPAVGVGHGRTAALHALAH